MKVGEILLINLKQRINQLKRLAKHPKINTNQHVRLDPPTRQQHQQHQLSSTSNPHQDRNLKSQKRKLSTKSIQPPILFVRNRPSALNEFSVYLSKAWSESEPGKQ